MATFTSVDSTRNSTSPRQKVWPVESLASLTGSPRTKVPLVESQSRSRMQSFSIISSQWWAEMVGCSIWKSFLGLRPSRVTPSFSSITCSPKPSDFNSNLAMALFSLSHPIILSLGRFVHKNIQSLYGRGSLAKLAFVGGCHLLTTYGTAGSNNETTLLVAKSVNRARSEADRDAPRHPAYR